MLVQLAVLLLSPIPRLVQFFQQIQEEQIKVKKKKTYNKCKERFSKLKLNNAIRKVWSSV